jgi:phage terminase large subunit GpA-like protein
VAVYGNIGGTTEEAFRPLRTKSFLFYPKGGVEMDKIIVTLPDQAKKEYARGITVWDVATDIGKKLAKDAIAGRVNGVLVDLVTPILEDAAVEVITFQSEEGPDIFRHTTSHILAQAVKRLFPDAQVGNRAGHRRWLLLRFCYGPAFYTG